MSNTPSLATSTVIIHPDHGKGVVICNYEDNGFDMVDIHWQSLNIIMEHRKESLLRQLTSTTPSATRENLWAKLASEEK